MKKELREKFPQFCGDTSTNYDLMLSDDIDSYMCYMFQNKNMKRKLNYFVDWNKHYIDNNGNKIPCQCVYRAEKTGNKVICLDMALEDSEKFPSWDNHVVKISNNDTYNTNSANINSIMGISNSNYYDKFVGSSFITMLSYYDINVNNWTEDQKLVLSCIDGLYVPWKVKFKDFRPVQRKYLELLGYECLEEFISYYINKNGYSDFYKCIDRYNLNSKIYINEEGKLQTDIKLQELSEVFNMDLSLPNIEFDMIDKFDKHTVNLKNNITNKDSISNGSGILFNVVIPNKDFCIYSTLKN